MFVVIPVTEDIKRHVLLAEANTAQSLLISFTERHNVILNTNNEYCITKYDIKSENFASLEKKT